MIFQFSLRNCEVILNLLFKIVNFSNIFEYNKVGAEILVLAIMKRRVKLINLCK